MQLKFDALFQLVGQRVAVAFFRALVGEFLKVVGLEFYAV